MIVDTSVWHWQQWFFVSTWLLMLWSGFYLNGKPRTGNYTAAPMLIRTLIAAFVLASAGFFK